MRLTLACILACSAACGGSSPPGPGSTGTVTETLNVSGTTRANGPGSCTGETHAFDAAAGTIAITLTQTTPSESLTVQICPPSGSAGGSCTFTRRQINVGQTLEAERQGGSQQHVSLLPLTCGTNAPPSPEPITYTARIVYQKAR